MTKPRLAKSMTEEQFDNGYWYETNLFSTAASLADGAGGRLGRAPFLSLSEVSISLIIIA